MKLQPESTGLCLLHDGATNEASINPWLHHGARNGARNETRNEATIDIPENDEEEAWLQKQNYTNTVDNAYTG